MDNDIETLTEEDVAKIPEEIRKKVLQIISFQSNELLVQKILVQNKEKEVETLKIEQDHQILQLRKALDDKVGITASLEESRNKIAAKLSKIEEDFTKLQNQFSENEAKMLDMQKQLSHLTSERDHFSFMVDRRNEQIERLQKDVQEMEKLLSSPSAEERGSNTLSFKETMLEQEKQFLQNQQISLRRDLDRNIQELLSVKRECSLKVMTVENKLQEKSKELKLAKTTISQLEKENENLILKIEDLTSKTQNDSEDVKKMLDFYERELQSQKRLVQLHKESSDDNEKQMEKLTTTIKELQQYIFDNTNEFSAMENAFKVKEVEFLANIQAKETMINNLQEEINILTQLVKSTETSFDRASHNTNNSQSANGSDRLNITEIYCKYVKATEQLFTEKQESDKLRSQLKNILTEIEERAPIMKQQTLEYQTLVEANIKLNNQLDTLLAEKNTSNNNLEGIMAKLAYLERKNAKLITERGDLGRQVCHLLREVEQLRGGTVTDNGIMVSFDLNADEVITKRLVTFSNIQELQENNTKLLLLVRDLSTKLEEMEETQQIAETSKFEEKMSSYLKKIEDLQSAQEKQTRMIKTCIDQRDRYRELYLDSVKDSKAEDEIDLTGIKSHPKENISELLQKIKNLEEKVQELEQNRTEAQNNLKLLNEEKESVRAELREQTAKNFKLASTVEFKMEQLKMREKTTETLKNQIETLEARNRNYESIMSKHELTIRSMSEELFKMQNQRANDEVMLQHLKRENEYLRNAESRLVAEKQQVDKETHNQHLLLQNLEQIKANLQKSETESRVRLERSLEEATRECFALRRHLQEETTAFKAKLAEAESQLKSSREALSSKNAEVVSMQEELSVLKETLTQKVKENEEFARNSDCLKLNNKSDRGESLKETTRKIQEQNIEIDSLKRELALTREHSKQYCNMAELLEKELRTSTLAYKEETKKLNAEIQALQKENSNTKDKIAEIEEQLLLQMSKPSKANSKDEFVKLQEELKDLIEKHKEANKELKYLRDHCSELTGEMQKTEQKYANEMILHSADVQALASLKEDYQKLQDEMNLIKLTKNTSNELLAKKQESWNEMEKHYLEEQQNMKLQLENLQKHNDLLHNQIQELSSNVSHLTKDKDHTLDEMFESKSSEELLQIINYLRKEKDFANSKFEIAENECSRIKLELELLQKSYQEVKRKLEAERVETEILVTASSKHDELLRRLEMMNAITDSNRILREERDSIAKRLAQTASTLETLEATLMPLQDKNKELQSTINILSNENSSLRIEVTRWRQRANTLVERSNKTSIEDFKKLTNEKDNLVKQIANEKENNKRQCDELNLLRSEKSKLEIELNNLKKSSQASEEETAKEILVLRSSLEKLQNEIKETSALLSEKEIEIVKLTEENTSKETQLNDLRNKELQVRKIAKRYKDLYTELQKKVDEKSGDFNLASQQSDGVEAEDNTNSITEENNTLKREIEMLKTRLENEERNRNLMREAKQRILALQTANKDLQEKLESFHDANEAVTFSGSDHEGNNKHLQSSHISQLPKENEVFSNKSQINRQIALQSVKPMPASTSCDKSIIEPLRTANVKPITPSTTQNTSTITSWRGSETPLASIRPMTVQSSGRSIGIIPNSATTTDATTSSINYDVSCAISNSVSNTVVVATVPPLGSIDDNAGDAESLQCTMDESNSSTGSLNAVHHTVAHVSPRVEQAHSNEATFPQITGANDTEMKIPMSTTQMQPASSSIQPSTTTHLNSKRVRDIELMGAQDENSDNPLIKKSRLIEGGEAKPSVTKFTSDIEYQVPTSSQHDQEEDIIEIEEDREVSIQFSEKNSQETSSTLKDTQKKEEVTSQNTIEDCEENASSTDTNANPCSSNNWYQNDKTIASGTSVVPVALHTTMTEENSPQSREENLTAFENSSSNDLDQTIPNEETTAADTVSKKNL